MLFVAKIISKIIYSICRTLVKLDFFALTISVFSLLSLNIYTKSVSRKPAKNLSKKIIFKAATGTTKIKKEGPMFANLDVVYDFYDRKDKYHSLLKSYKNAWFGNKKLNPRSEWTPPSDRKTRILVLSHQWNFMYEPIKALDRNGCEIRTFDMTTLDKVLNNNKFFYKGLSKFNLSLLEETPTNFNYSDQDIQRNMKLAAPIFASLIEWADVVFCEWARVDHLRLCQPMLDDSKKLIVRCHSYEVFTHRPMLINHDRIDHMIFIADHIREVYKIHPIDDPSLMERSSVIQNIRTKMMPSSDLENEARQFSLGVLGYSKYVKDALLALEILDKLVSQDKRWKLHLAGSPLEENLEGVEGAYASRVFSKIEELKEHVIIDPFITNKEEWFDKIGFIMSTSLREGSHEAVVEGMYNSCIPVIRKWPSVSRFNAHETSFGERDYFDNAQQAVSIINKLQQNYQAEAKRSHEFASEHFFSDKIADSFLGAVLSPVEQRNKQ